MKNPHKLSSLFVRVLILILASTIILPACGSAISPQPTAQPVAIYTLQDLQTVLKEIDQANPGEAQARADELWQALEDGKRIPLILGTQVFFLYIRRLS